MSDRKYPVAIAIILITLVIIPLLGYLFGR